MEVGDDVVNEKGRRELEAILAWPVLARAPSVSRILTYICEQHFAGKAASIKEYNIAVEALGRPASFDPSADSIEALKGFCIDSRLHTILQQIANSKDKDAPYFYVDFILTTANTWKTPIEDFTLTVERPHLKDPNHPSFANYVSFCWDGPITKIDADHFSAHAVNFVPKKELSIGFFDVEKSVF